MRDTKNSLYTHSSLLNHLFSSSTDAHPTTSHETSTTASTNPEQNVQTKSWVQFEDDDEEEEAEYEKVKQWETFDEDETTKQPSEETNKPSTTQWEKLENGPEQTRNNKNLHLEMSFGNVNESAAERPSTRSITG